MSTLLSTSTSCKFVERGDFPTIPTESILNTTKLFLYQLSTGVLHLFGSTQWFCHKDILWMTSDLFQMKIGWGIRFKFLSLKWQSRSATIHHFIDAYFPMRSMGRAVYKYPLHGNMNYFKFHEIRKLCLESLELHFLQNKTHWLVTSLRSP